MKKLCVVFGGKSAEHDISIITGIQLSKNFNKLIEKIYLGLDNKFYLVTKISDVKHFADKGNLKLREVVFYNQAVYSKRLFKKLFDVECVVNCCHGGYGEDGTLASFFEMNKIKITSANSLSSHIAMDKNLCKILVEKIAPTIRGIKVNKDNYDDAVKLISGDFSNDLIVKPNSLGSSVGVKVCNKTNFTNQIDAIFELDDEALVEERVVDLIEYNQACFKDSKGLVLSAIEQPLTKHEVLTFEDKYQSINKSKGQDRIIPARMSKDMEEKINSYTKNIYSHLNMSGVVRIDYIFDNKSKNIYFNEINTIPGSMAFYLFEPVGIDYITLIEKLIDSAEELKKFTYIDTQILKDKNI